MLNWIKLELGCEMPKEDGLYICEIHIRNSGIHSISVRYLEYRKVYPNFIGLHEGEWVDRYLLESEELDQNLLWDEIEFVLRRNFGRQSIMEIDVTLIEMKHKYVLSHK